MKGGILAGCALLLVACGGSGGSSSGGGGGSSGDDSGSSGNGDSPPESESVAITLDADPPAGGEVTGGGTFDPGETVSVEAQAAEFYEFAGWFDGEEAISDGATHAFEAETDLTITARFSQVETAIPVNLPDEGSLFRFAADHAREGLAFVVTVGETVGDDLSAVWRTTDHGSTWEKVLPTSTGFIEIGSPASDVVVMGAPEGYRLSFDGGQTWTQGEILDPVFGDPISFRDASISTESDSIYLASPSVMAPGLYRSVDNGESWQWIFSDEDVEDFDDSRLQFVHVRSNDDGTIYIGPLFGTNVQKSIDAGDSWFSIQTGLTTEDFLLSEGMRVDSSDADRLFIRNNISVNGGANWSQREGLSPARTAWLDGKLVTIEGLTVRVSDDYGETWRDVMPLTDDTGLSFGRPDRIYVSEESLYFHGSNIEPLYRIELDAIREQID